MIEDDTLVYKKAEVAAVKEKTLQVAAKQRLCLFQSNKENNQLNAALGNLEHTGHICGIGSHMPWKRDFLKDSTSYKSLVGTRKPRREGQHAL
jgi:hypothetical protein